MVKFIRIVFIFFIAVFSTASVLIACGGLILYKYSDSHVEDEIINAASSCKNTEFLCYESDADGIKAQVKKVDGACLDNGINFEQITFDRIPQDLINAFVSVEDKRFFSHSGIDYRRSLKAILNYIFTHNSSFGGSTITQQLVKNITGNDEKLVVRKITEAFCAMDIEKRYDKSEILEMYLNIINLAHGCRGIGAASRYYFDKMPSELTLCECASIAAITNNPSKYDPQSHPEENKKRRSVILKCMLESGYISEEEYEKAITEEIVLSLRSTEKGKVNSWYIDAVTNDVIADYAQKYGVTRQQASMLIYSGGYKIYTAMDESLQSIIEEYFENTNNFPSDNDGSTPSSSMIIIDPASGDILAIAGNIGRKTANRIQNYATDTKRPPGSAIKPLSVYAPAIEMGLINWATIIEDAPVKIYDNDTPWPSNANKKYMGNVTVKYAISNSLNTVPVKILHQLGNKSSYDFLTEKLNFTSLDKTRDIGDAALALGQPSYGVTLRELTSAYSIFYDGSSKKSRTYYKVTDSNGRIILSNETDIKSVISKETASIMTKLLESVITEGTASGYIQLDGEVEVAGKTGTTQYCNDKYFIGFTPDLIAGVWQGYDYPRPLDFMRWNYAICVWDGVMNEVYSDTQYKYGKKNFEVSKNVQELSYNKTTGLPPENFDDVSEIEYGWFDIKDRIFG